MSNDMLGRRVYYAGEVIFREGESGDRAYLIESGRVEILKQDPAGKRVLGTIGKGAIFGEMALIDKKPRMADAVAVEKTTVIAVNDTQFQEKVDEAAPFIAALLRVFVQNTRRLEDEVGRLLAQKQALEADNDRMRKSLERVKERVNSVEIKDKSAE